MAQKAMLTAVSKLVARHSLTSSYFRTFFPIILTASFIGAFGWGTLALPTWVYLLYLFALGACAVSWLEGFQNRRVDRRLSCALLIIILLNLMIVVYINLTFPQPNGRYLLPALPAIALLLGLGLKSRPSWSTRRTVLTVSALAVANLAILIFVVIPAYWPPVIN